MAISSIEEVLQDVREGKMVIIVDDEDRENEGDVMIAAEKVTPEAINFMATHGRGLICLSLPGERVDALGLPLMFWLVKRLRLRQGAFFLLYAAWFSAVRLAMLPLRALTYPDIIKTIIYPLLYVTIILLGIITTLRREF